MTRSHLLPLLCCTFLSLLGISRAFPNPQVASVPPTVTNPSSINPPSPVATAGVGTGIFVADSSDNATNAITPTDDVVDGVNLPDFAFNPLQMPTKPGLSGTKVIKAVLTGPSAAPNSALTSRTISDYVTLHYNDGSITTQNGTTVYSVAVNATAMAQMLQDATVYAQSQFDSGNILGNESDHNYYRFTSQGLTVVAMAYGEAGSGDPTFNWGDFAIITGFLHNLTIDHPTRNMTWNGYVTMTDNTRGVDFFIVPSFGDIPDSGSPLAAAATPAAASNPIGGADGGLRLAKRAFAINLGVDNVRMTVRRATTQVMASLLAHLSQTALDTLIADSGQSPPYRELISRTGDSTLDVAFPNEVMQIVATNQLVSKDVMIAALQFLVQLTEPLYVLAGQVPTMYGELMRGTTIIARWSLGSMIAGPSCVVQNPDGSYAIGCFIRN